MARGQGRRRQPVVMPRLALMLLRISLGMLLIWWGLARVRNPDLGVAVSDRFYVGAFSNPDLQLVFGHFEAGIGVMVVLGLFRTVVLPIQLVIVGFSSAMVWSALVDPFGLLLESKHVGATQHLFYPSLIILCAAGVLWAMRHADRWALDYYFVGYVHYMRERQEALMAPSRVVIPPVDQPLAGHGVPPGGAPAPVGETAEAGAPGGEAGPCPAGQAVHAA